MNNYLSQMQYKDLSSSQRLLLCPNCNLLKNVYSFIDPIEYKFNPICQDCCSQYSNKGKRPMYQYDIQNKQENHMKQQEKEKEKHLKKKKQKLELFQYPHGQFFQLIKLLDLKEFSLQNSFFTDYIHHHNYSLNYQNYLLFSIFL